MAKFLLKIFGSNILLRQSVYLPSNQYCQFSHNAGNTLLQRGTLSEGLTDISNSESRSRLLLLLNLQENSESLSCLNPNLENKGWPVTEQFRREQLYWVTIGWGPTPKSSVYFKFFLFPGRLEKTPACYLWQTERSFSQLLWSLQREWGTDRMWPGSWFCKSITGPKGSK